MSDPKDKSAFAEQGTPGIQPDGGTAHVKSRSSSNFNKVEVTLNLHHFQPVASKFETNELRFGPQECYFGDQKDSQMIKNRPFLIRGGPDAPPGAPKASWTAYTAADCTLPPGTLGTTLDGSA